MHMLSVATLFIVFSLIGVEFSLSAFIYPAAWRLEPEQQLKLLSRLAHVFGRVMPVWFVACAVLFGMQTWLQWHAPGVALLLAADALWVLASAGGILFLVPDNSRIAAGDADWQRIHRRWDRRHRVRTTTLAIAALLFTYGIVR